MEKFNINAFRASELTLQKDSQLPHVCRYQHRTILVLLSQFHWHHEWAFSGSYSSISDKGSSVSTKWGVLHKPSSSQGIVLLEGFNERTYSGMDTYRKRGLRQSQIHNRPSWECCVWGSHSLYSSRLQSYEHRTCIHSESSLYGR